MHLRKLIKLFSNIPEMYLIVSSIVCIFTVRHYVKGIFNQAFTIIQFHLQFTKIFMHGWENIEEENRICIFFVFKHRENNTLGTQTATHLLFINNNRSNNKASATE